MYSIFMIKGFSQIDTSLKYVTTFNDSIGHALKIKSETAGATLLA